MHDTNVRAHGRGRWVRQWWLWPLALLMLGCALMLGAHAWSREDEPRKPPSRATREPEPLLLGDRSPLVRWHSSRSDHRRDIDPSTEFTAGEPASQ